MACNQLDTVSSAISSVKVPAPGWLVLGATLVVGATLVLEVALVLELVLDTVWVAPADVGPPPPHPDSRTAATAGAVTALRTGTRGTRTSCWIGGPVAASHTSRRAAAQARYAVATVVAQGGGAVPSAAPRPLRVSRPSL